MKLFTKICLIGALVLVCIGAVFLIGGLAAGASLAALRNASNISTGHSFAETGDLSNVFWFWGRNHNRNFFENTDKSMLYYSDGEIAENITEINVNVKACDVYVYWDSGKEDGVLVNQYIPNPKQTFSAEMNGGVLRIVEDTEFSSTNFMDYGYAEIFVYLPKGYEPENVRIALEAGNVYFHDGLSAKLLIIDSGAGDIDFSDDITVNTMRIEQGMGDLKSSGKIIVEQKADFYNGVGDIDLDNLICTGDTYLEQGMGDLNLSGTIEGNLSVENGAGDIKVSLKGDQMDYNYDLSCGAGDMTFNGWESSGVSGNYTAKNNPQNSMITIHSGMGDIDLEIK